jgi:hypothetical protein
MYPLLLYTASLHMPFLQGVDPSAYANPNGYTVLLALIATLGPMFATVVTYFLTKRDTNRIKEETVAQTPKLDTIHVLVNGRMTSAQAEIDSLKAQVAALTAKPTPPPVA